MMEFLQSRHSVKCTPRVIDTDYPSPRLEFAQATEYLNPPGRLTTWA